MVKTATQPTPTNDEGVTGIISSRKADGDAPIGTKARNVFDMVEAGTTPAASRKAQFLGSVRQHLAELADATADMDGIDAERVKLADSTAVELYQARVDGLLTADELSALLGDYFGFKEKKDGSPSKTPEKAGNVLRQRIVRAVAAAEFLDGKNDGGAFYKSLPEECLDDIQSVRNRLDSGQIGIWTAYKELGDIRSENVSRPKLVFDASRISKLADDLADISATIDAWGENDALLSAYAKLRKVINIAGEAMAAETETE